LLHYSFFRSIYAFEIIANTSLFSFEMSSNRWIGLIIMQGPSPAKARGQMLEDLRQVGAK
jgi:hypothetical protein